MNKTIQMSKDWENQFQPEIQLLQIIKYDESDLHIVSSQSDNETSLRALPVQDKQIISQRS